LVLRRGGQLRDVDEEHERYSLGMRPRIFLFCLTIEPVYARLRASLGEEGALFTYYDDSYFRVEHDRMAEVLAQAPRIF
jgi:hypothetical protein